MLSYHVDVRAACLVLICRTAARFLGEVAQVLLSFLCLMNKGLLKGPRDHQEPYYGGYSPWLCGVTGGVADPFSTPPQNHAGASLVAQW